MTTAKPSVDTENDGPAGGKSSTGAYDYRHIEQYWRQYWLEHGTCRTLTPGDTGYDPDQPKCYILDMFPYPSGEGLHIGQRKCYIASEIYRRVQRCPWCKVLNPSGFDPFDLPARPHPAPATKATSARGRRPGQGRAGPRAISRDAASQMMIDQVPSAGRASTP